MKEDLSDFQRDITVSLIGTRLVHQPLIPDTRVPPRLVDLIDRFIQNTPFKELIYVNRSTNTLRYHSEISDESKLAIEELLINRNVVW